MSGHSQDWRYDAPRPAVPPAFTFGMLVWGSCAAAFSSARAMEGGLCLALAGALGAISALGCIAGLLARARWALFPIAIALGCLLAFAQASALHAASSGAGGMPEHIDVRACMLEDAKAGSAGFSGTALIAFGDERPMRVMARLPEGREWRFGESFEATCTFKAADFSKSDYDWTRGVAIEANMADARKVAGPAPLEAVSALRSNTIDRLDNGRSSGALLQALVCGYRANMRGEALYAAFQTCGLAHLVAVSGAHLVIVTGMFASALRAVKAPRRLSVFLLVGIMFAYLAFSGAPVSALRATIMSGVGLLALFGKRRPSSLNALGVGAILIVGSAPYASVSASFALSTSSTAGIVLFSPLVQAWLRRTPFGRATIVAEPLALTLSASVLSQPLACALFTKLPLISPLANVIAAPLLPPACALGLAAAAIGILLPQVASPLIGAAESVSWLLGQVVSALSSVPYACVPVSIGVGEAVAFSLVVGAVLWIGWTRIRPAGAAATCAVAAALAMGFFLWPHGDEIVMLDVGQGDAFMLRSGGKALLVDTGNHDDQLLAGLAGNGVVHLDAVLLTHKDDDHCGALDAMAQTVRVDTALVAAGVLESDDATCAELVAGANAAASSVIGARYGDKIEVGAFTATVVWPHELADDGGNADSLCLYVEYDGDADGSVDATALFTGDAEEEQLAAILAENAIGHVDVLKVGHHGSRNGMDEKQARELSPTIALIGVGANNRYGHPTPEILQMLDDVGCRVFRSDEDGEVRCSLAADSIRVSPMK